MMEGLRERVDVVQRRHPTIGFTYAVLKRYGEDHGVWLGSLIRSMGFSRSTHLAIVFVTAATWLFKDWPDALQRILEALWSKVPFAEAG